MSCTNPKLVQKYECPATGLKTVKFKFKGDSDMQLPCGKCQACRLDKAREWSLRCYHESLLHDESCFISLTYADEHLPANGSLHHRDFQLFMKRLRIKFPEKDISYLMCGEYGPNTHRAHYHVIAFGYYPSDAKLSRNKDGFRYYTSETVDKLWRKGNTLTTEFTQANARYVANYCQKKDLPNKAFQERFVYYDETGAGHVRDPDYAKMSTRPPIGLRWAEKHTDWQINGYFIDANGAKVPVPKLYREKLRESEEEGAPDVYEHLLKLRAKAIKPSEQTPDRLRQKAICVAAKAKNSVKYL